MLVSICPVPEDQYLQAECHGGFRIHGLQYNGREQQQRTTKSDFSRTPGPRRATRSSLLYQFMGARQ